MKKIILLSAAFLALAGCQSGEPQLATSSVKKVLKAMTLEEKTRLVIGMGMAGSDGSSAVVSLSRREKEALFHTHADLSRVSWQLDRDGHMVPVTCCDWHYLESAFIKVDGVLPSKSFVRIHRSFIVNGNRIDSISSQGDIKVGGALLHVSEGYRDAFETFLG